VQLRFKLDIFLPDLVGTTAVPAHAYDIAELTELTELTPALDTAMAAHDTADQASEVVRGTYFVSDVVYSC